MVCTTARASAQLWSADQSARADQHTMQALGVPSQVLMERAALCCARVVVERLAGEPLPVVVLCGPGNNGGDGLALARILHGWGVQVRAVLCSQVRNAAAEHQREIAEAAGVSVGQRLDDLPRRALVCDALLGTGSRGRPRQSIRDALAAQCDVVGPRIAIDVPTGVDVDLGRAHTGAFVADVTVTFAVSKPGLHITPGREHAGRVIVADMGIVGPEATPGPPSACLIDPLAVARDLQSRPEARYKGERGHVAVVGGGAATPGAVILCAAASMRAGAGLASVVSPNPEVHALLVAHRPELMVSVGRSGEPLAPAAGVLVVGPGLTDPPASDEFPRALWSGDRRPAVWDASALAHVPEQPPAGPRVITPHPGEAAQLLARFDPGGGWNNAAVIDRRLEAAILLAQRTQAITVLKGAGTIVADPTGAVAVAIVGGPELATAGTGDALAGAIGALLAGGLAGFWGACIGVHIHGLAGCLARARYPRPLAMEVADALSSASDPDVVRAHPGRFPTLMRG